MSNNESLQTARRRQKDIGQNQTSEKVESKGSEQASLNIVDESKPIEQADSKELLATLNPRWRNWWIRTIFTWLMIIAFLFILYLGPLALIILIQLIQIKCFHEIISIGHKKYQSLSLPWFRTLSWYFLLCSNYFFYGESISEYFQGLLTHEHILLQYLIQYHRLISYGLYCIGIMLFVNSLKKDFYKKQFALFGWTHITLLVIVTQSHLVIQTLFEGMIWFFLPVSLVICNDIWAYIFGFFFGKTPLIKLSPKKTWEGFIGGGVMTIVYSFVGVYIMCHFDYFTCPVEYNSESKTFLASCSPAPLYQLTKYPLPAFLHYPSQMFGFQEAVIWMYPMQIHAFFLALFSSLIAPFGGFFASGFKRAFKVKDFGDTIPGHGGLMDRFDCQLLMGTFTYVYHFTLIRAPNPGKILRQIMSLSPEQQLLLFKKLQEELTQSKMLGQ
ncbi:phosphatidate cytidylyltransferase 1-like [Dendronephthya gigantea]|uniref:phosphatidate cytidylyltransferase 1-like n=1 Tax=Dendronephthya gigantea TaxID=151771 RepID=UPI0010696B0B|nr:phosphatidate cytidylyltransferase 1-like [Dendronephthya gigantea]